MYLIDGNNLIGHTKSISYEDPRARQILLDRLGPFLTLKRRKATVVFYGATESLRKGSLIQLVFAGPASNADEIIRRRVEHLKSRRGLCVVSSDNAVYGYARSCGVEALKCHEFNRLLREVPEGEPEIRDAAAGDLIIRHWLRYFGEDDGA
jgi:predicted RNA-binding protein with PIN domain